MRVYVYESGKVLVIPEFEILRLTDKSFSCRGLKAYLSKWNNRGFDGDVKRLVSLLEAGTAAEAEQLVRMR